MPKNISFLQYMRAHGNTPGPTQRPYSTGAIGGIIAAIPSEALLYWCGSFIGVSKGVGVSVFAVQGVHAVLMVLFGMLYAAIFKRAANDRMGGWLFGAAYGFLLWMFAPFTIWQLVSPRPLAVGLAAMGFFAAHVLYGLLLGLLFPRIHAMIQARLKKTAEGSRKPREAIERTIVRHPRPDFVGQTAKAQTEKR
jgi:hypothetical protein